MTNFIGCKCSICGAEYRPDEVQYVCPKDSGNLDIVLDYPVLQQSDARDQISRSGVASMWRYFPLLPAAHIPDGSTPIHTVGWSPVYHLNNIAVEKGVRNLFLKDDGRNPTASFKDRASAMVVERTMEIGAEVVVTASTGNAGAALAGMAAATGQKAVIFAPRTAPKAKIAQLLVYGARVILVEGSYDDAFDLAVGASHEFGWYCRNTGYNPFTMEGKKTAAFEIWEQLIVPNKVKKLSIFVSVGDGNIISSIHKGFKELLALGWIDEMPRINGVQSERSDAVYQAFKRGDEQIIPVQSTTLADSISVDFPRDGVRAVRAAKETGGRIVAVSDYSILHAIADLGRQGVFTEPAAAAAFAGFCQVAADGLIGDEDDILVMNTGNGLKDVSPAMKIVPEPVIIEPTMAALQKLTF